MEKVSAESLDSGKDPAFRLFFHDKPASRNSVISIPNTIFFPNTASRANILANPTPRGRSSPVFLRKFAFSWIPHYK